MASKNNKALKIALGVGAGFMALMALIVFLAAKRVVTPQLALLMLVGLFGLYFGVGVLIAVYRFVAKLQ